MAKTQTRTEEEMLVMLRDRYTKNSGNGPAWAFTEKVRNAAGFDATGTADAMAMSLWPSRGLHLHGFEIKVTRQDWLREQKDPAKAEKCAKFCDKWWLVVGDKDIVKPGELPEPWGLLVAQGSRLVCKDEAKLLPPGPISRSFLASLMRSACRAGDVTPQEIKSAVQKALIDEQRWHETQVKELEQEVSKLKQRELLFQKLSGITLREFSGDDRLVEVATALKAVLEGSQDQKRLITSIEMISDDAGRLQKQAQRVCAKYSEEREAA